MGCASSGTKTAPRVRRKVQPIILLDSYEEEEEDNEALSPVGAQKPTFEDEFSSIIEGINNIYVEEDVTPIIPLSSCAFPVAVSEFGLDDEESSVTLPIITISNSEHGKYVVFGSMGYLKHKNLIRNEISALIENLSMWCTEFKMKTIHVLLYGFKDPATSLISADLASFGYTTDIAKSKLPEDLSYDFILMPSYVHDYETLPRIREYAKTGCVFVFVTLENETKKGHARLNRFLAHAGIAVPYCIMKPSMKNSLPVSLENLKPYTFQSLYEKYLAVISEPHSFEEINSVVSCLRYYISVLTPNEGQMAADIVSKTWDYLIKNEYQKDGIYCQDLTQSVLAVLLSDITPSVPAELIGISPVTSMFPGLCGEVEYLTERMKTKLKRNKILSLNLYLPPGRVATIHTSNSITVQIGSHIECLLEKASGWKRWPIVTTTVVIDKASMDIASPYGGFVYISSTETKSVSLTFEGFCRFPIYSIDRDTWSETKDSKVPWGEIVLNHMTIIVPTNYLVSIPDFKKLANDLETMIDNALAFISLKVCKCHCIIFDADIATEYPTYGERIVLLLSDLPNALDATKPSVQLLMTLNLIVAASIPENSLDDDAIVAISTVAACHSFSVQFPDVNPTNFIKEKPALFNELWKVAVRKPKEFTSGTSAYLLHRFDASTHVEELWEAFIKELKISTGEALLTLSDRFKMTRLLEQNSSGFLKSFVVEEVDNLDILDIIDENEEEEAPIE